MKYQSINLTVVLSFFSLLLFGFTTSNAQLADEIRPFDFSNDYYKSNGLIAGLLQDRRNGEDRRSVFDTPTDLSKFTNVRIIETLPAYAGDGTTIFWNRYAVATDESFRPDKVGDRAAELANAPAIHVSRRINHHEAIFHAHQIGAHMEIVCWI